MENPCAVRLGCVETRAEGVCACVCVRPPSTYFRTMEGRYRYLDAAPARLGP